MKLKNGVVEINGKRTKVGRQEIRKLKRILDELGIMHIIDDVSFCSAFHVAGHMEDLHDSRMSKAENGGRVFPENRFALKEQFQFRELKIPNFCLLDFISLAQLEDEQAEFLGDLVNGNQY